MDGNGRRREINGAGEREDVSLTAQRGGARQGARQEAAQWRHAPIRAWRRHGL